MKTIRHRFLQYKIDPATEILIVGTFNPETENNPAEIFYGRSRNFLWRLLPIALGEDDLKKNEPGDKLNFISQHKIGFIDLVAEVTVDIGSETNYNDSYIDSRVTQWRDVINTMKQLPHLKKVCFTRKTFSDIPQVKKKLAEVEIFCKEKGIPFQCLATPSRIYSTAKQEEWNNFFSQ
jgi:G:T/U-mismatch repair DNA glycosylase